MALMAIDAEMARYTQSDAFHFITNGVRMDLTMCRRGEQEYCRLYTQPDLLKAIDWRDFIMKKLTRWNFSTLHYTRRKVNHLCLEKKRPHVEVLAELRVRRARGR